MEGEDTTLDPIRRGAGQFADTHWSVVLAAKATDSPQAAKALEKLCLTYWPPLYAFIRRQGYRVEDAQDLTQEFLYSFIDKDGLGHLQDQRGKFRSFLLTFLKHFLSDQRDRASAHKRGGGREPVSLEQMAEEERNWAQPLDWQTPEQVFERRWAQALLEQVGERLRLEYVDSGKSAKFELLKDIQPGERATLTYADIGVRLGISEQAVKNSVLRLRQRHRALLRAEIAATVSGEEEVDEEIRHLIAVLGRESN